MKSSHVTLQYVMSLQVYKVTLWYVTEHSGRQCHQVLHYIALYHTVLCYTKFINPSMPRVTNYCCSKGSVPYWITGLTHYFQFLIFGRSGGQSWAT